MKNVKISLFLILSINLVIFIFPNVIQLDLQENRKNNEKQRFERNLKISELTHEPINITSDSEFTSANGVIGGSGIEQDPYIIANWNIDAGGNRYGILIENTQKYFKIENCTVFNSGESSHPVIKLFNISNGFLFKNNCSNNNTLNDDIFIERTNNTIIQDNHCHGSYYGITLIHSYNNIISDNIVNGIFNGIYLYQSSNNSIFRNFCHGNAFYGILLSSSGSNIIQGNKLIGNKHGICLDWSANNNLVENNCSTNSYGIYIQRCSYNNKIKGNNIHNNSKYGIYLERGGTTNIIKNNCSSNEIAIYILKSNNNSLIGNLCTKNKIHGIYFEISGNNLVKENNITENIKSGIVFIKSDLSFVSNNTISKHEIGLNLTSSNNNNFFLNSISNNIKYGIYLENSNSNNIYLNNFINNGIGNVYLVSLSLINTWNSLEKLNYTYGGNNLSKFLGNFWDDYLGSDSNNDGIGDTPYNVNFGQEDYYPLIELFKNYVNLSIPPPRVFRIHIDGNWTETAMTYDWCTGSGTYEDPYLIKDLVINAGGVGCGIIIENTNDYFKIINCSVHNSGIYLEAIKVLNVLNGKLINNTVSFNLASGISIYSSSNISLNDNICEGNYHGIYLVGLEFSKLEGNDCIGNIWDGIRVTASDENKISSNICNKNERAIALTDSNNNILSRNNCSKNILGMGIWHSDNNKIEYNNCSSNAGYGILLQSSESNLLLENLCSDNNAGISITASSTLNRLVFNILADNYIGIRSENSHNNDIYLNNFKENLHNGYSVDSVNKWSSQNRINYTYKNSNCKNYIGNFWNDYSGSDSNNDGIGDSLYIVDGSEIDYYPLIEEINHYYVDILSPLIISPLDITYMEGTTGHNITWIVTDDHPYNYTIFRDEVEVKNGTWSSDTPIIINIDNLSVGTYLYLIKISDTNDNFATDSVLVTVEDNTDPTWDEALTDQTVKYGTSFSYDVNASDASGIEHYWINDTFSFQIDGNGVIYNVTPLSSCDYWLEIRAYDPYNNYAEAIIKVTVQIEDFIAPKWDETPTNQILMHGESFSYGLSAYDASSIDHYWINDTIKFNINSDGLITNATALEVGEYWIEVRAYDPHDNYCSAKIKITVEDMDHNGEDDTDDTNIPIEISGYEISLLLFIGGISAALLVIYKKKEN